MTHTPLSDYDRGCLAGLVTQHNAAGDLVVEIRREMRERLARVERHNRLLRRALFVASAVNLVLVWIAVWRLNG